MIERLRRLVRGFGSEPLDAPGRAAISRLLETPKYEILPLKSARPQMAFLPPGSTVSVTASPNKTLEDTLDLCADLLQAGHKPIPHLSARMTKDRGHLESLLGRMAELGLRQAFVVGGDASDPGEFFDAGSLLSAMAEIGHDLTEIGIGSYPEGHHIVDDETALTALKDKQPHAAYMTTQMCFDGDVITSWIADVRRQGITLPVVLGIPGVADRLKLLKTSARIGVGQSARFLSKNRGLIAKFAKPGGYSADELLESMPATLDDPVANVVGVHIYTFNQIETTERWRLDYLTRLR